MGDLLAGIDSPADLKLLRPDQLGGLAEEIRGSIISYVEACGGHLASNLGVVELTVALHYVFDAPRDKIILDVSHQCYAHKMLTGRRAAFCDPTRFGEASGFTNPDESEYDLFKVGHSSTAISLACGLARARDLLGEDHAVVAVVGDGALSGGEAFEGLNNAATLGSGLIVVVNDNERSIAANVGGLYDSLAALRQSDGRAESNPFRVLGFDYLYVGQGNDTDALVKALWSVRGAARPTVVHVHTVKGKGDAWAQAHPEAAHELRPCGPHGERPAPGGTVLAEVASGLLALAGSDPRVVVISPATPLSHGLTPEVRSRLGDQFVDVGIAEGHAVSFAAALARGGARPVLCVSSTFLQRAYDQLVVDLALNDLPVTVLCYKAGLVDRDATHVGSLDVAFESAIPNLTCLAPQSASECVAMVGWSVRDGDGPVVIRVPREDARDACGGMAGGDVRWCVRRRGNRVAFIVLGSVGDEVDSVAIPLVRERLGFDASLVFATAYSSLDVGLLCDLERDHELVVVVEDGVVDGGLGQRVAAFYCNHPMHVLVRGAAKEFTQRVPLAEQYRRFRMSGSLLADDVCTALAGGPVG